MHDGCWAVGKTLKKTGLRTKTGVSLLQISRGKDTLPSPGPRDKFEAGDELLLIGETEQLRQAEHVGKDIVTEAKISAQAEVKKEYQLLEEKLQAERQNLQSEVANLVIDTTKTVLADTLTKQHQQAILNSQIGTLKKLRVRPS